MINEIQIQGSRETTWHDFVLTQVGMEITVSHGSYWRNGAKLSEEPEESTTITIDTPLEDVQLELWICGLLADIAIIQSGDELPIGAIDRIAWFTVPSGAVTLDEVQINTINMT